MAQYLISVWHEWDADDDVSPEEMQQTYAQVDAFNTRLQESGAWVFAGGLEPPSTATVVDGRGAAEPLLTDGPFVETKEQLGGFWVVDLPDLDAALVLAAEASAACRREVEVRPFQSE